MILNFGLHGLYKNISALYTGLDMLRKTHPDIKRVIIYVPRDIMWIKLVKLKTNFNLILQHYTSVFH